MTYARKRLLLGITGVGATVMLCAVSLWFDLPHQFIPATADDSIASTVAAVIGAVIVHALLLFGVDVVGGAIVVRESRPLLSWLGAWVRGVVVQLCWFALATLVLVRIATSYGHSWAVLAFVFLQLVLVARQRTIADLAGGVRDVSDGVAVASKSALASAATAAGLPPHTVRLVEGDDPAFVGGWTGFGAPLLIVPRRWADQLSGEQLRVVLSRRAAVLSSGLRTRGLLVAVAWNTAGFVLATSLPNAGLTSAADFVNTVAWFTIWSFVGVLALPTISRPAVIAADRSAARLTSTDAVVSTITALDRLQDDEPERAAGIEAVFHPVPSRASRVRALSSAETAVGGAGAWHATRMMLYLSWAGLGGLSRAVHCNVGRPALWVLLPGD
ncbi:MAG: hypothetical protein V4617_16355 [Gemmatimonadota bacterium]